MATETRKTVQDLLYLQTYSSAPDSQVLGMTLIENARIVPAGIDATKWPYQTVLDAIADGWRVVSFPNASSTAPPDDPQGFGYEFILERLS